NATLYDLLSAYAARRQERAISIVRVAARQVWSLQDARELLRRIVGQVADWTPLEAFLSPYLASAEMRATVKASTFGASLELVREGKIDLRQTEPFAPIYVRDRVAVAALNREP